MSLQDSNFISFLCIPRKEIAGLYDNSIEIFILFSIIEIPTYISTNNVQDTFFGSISSSHLLSFDFVINILTGMR
jgi:hypothetical protein